MTDAKVSSWTLGATADPLWSRRLHLPASFWCCVIRGQQGPTAFLVARTKVCGKTFLLSQVGSYPSVTAGKLLRF